jgi:hypothetical protein
MALLALILWAWLGPKLLRAHLVVDIPSAPGAAEWTCTWVRASDGQAHGSYVGVEPDAPRILEIEVSGAPQAGGNYFDFWLYDVRTDSGHKPDLVGLLDRAENPDSKGWKPFEQGPGITYVGLAPGRMTIPLEDRHARLAIARTRYGGPIKVSYRGYTIEENTYAPSTTPATIIIPPILATWPSGRIEQRLPVYEMRDLALSWKSPEPVTLEDPRIEFRIGDWTVFRRGLVPERSEENGHISLPADTAPGILAFAAGSLATFGLLAGALVVGLGLSRAGPTVLRSRGAAPVAVACVVVAVHAALAAYVPVQITSDGMDYLDAADHLARTGTFDRFPLYKAPGLSVLLAGAMAGWDDFLGAYAWMQAALGVLMSLGAYWLVRSRASRGWALGAALVVGLHPSLLTYETHLLRELPSAAVLTFVALAIVRIRDGLGRGGSAGRTWAWTVGLALLCAAGAYLRENLQLLVPLVPLILLVPGSGTWKQRSGRAVVVGVLSLVCLMPRGMVIYKEYGSFSMVSPKIQGNRLLASWVNLIADTNDPALLTREQYIEFRNTDLATPLNDYGFTGWILQKSLLAAPANRGQGQDWVTSEQIGREFLAETTARSPLRTLGTSVRAFISQLGLWNVQTGRMKTYAGSDEFYSMALRGERLPFATNYSPGTQTVMGADRMQANAAAMQDLIKRSRRSVKFLEDRPATRLFNEWFYTSRALRPVAAWLFIIGVCVAVARRDVALAGVGAIVLLSTFGAAFVVGTPTDRFGVPFIPMVWCVALIVVAQFAAGRFVRGGR